MALLKNDSHNDIKDLHGRPLL